jgi:hypothetical protein
MRDLFFPTFPEKNTCFIHALELGMGLHKDMVGMVMEGGHCIADMGWSRSGRGERPTPLVIGIAIAAIELFWKRRFSDCVFRFYRTTLLFKGGPCLQALRSHAHAAVTGQCGDGLLACRFSGNVVTSAGGAVYRVTSAQTPTASSISISSSIFKNNTAGGAGSRCEWS